MLQTIQRDREASTSFEVRTPGYKPESSKSLEALEEKFRLWIWSYILQIQKPVHLEEHETWS